MLCDPNWSYSTECTFTSKTSFSSPLSPFPLSEASSLRVFRSGEKKIEPPFSQALLLLSLQQYCSGSKPSLTLFSKIAEKKISKIFSSFFRILFSKSLLTFWSEKGFQISIFLQCIITAKRKKILSLLAASLETRAQKWPCTLVRSSFPRSSLDSKKFLCARKTVCEI